METLALALGLALPWLLGAALLRAFAWPRPSAAGAGNLALQFGYGYFVGALLLTLWMRALSAAGIAFGRASISVPLLAAAAALWIWLARRNRISLDELRNAAVALVRPQLPRWQRIAWTLLLAWLALRFVSLAVEVAWRPLYPWDAWTAWATKARVWYELKHIVPFADAETWLGGKAATYFDASPGNPATVPLLQVWSSVALGRWDDSAMNWPWPLALVGLTLAVYGALRDAGLSPLGALAGAYLVASLPLVDAHVALAGYADLLLSGVYTLAALALHRWALRRDFRDAVLALLLALACVLIKPQGILWALTLAPGAVAALLPRGGKVVAWSFAVAALGVLALTRFTPTVLGYSLHLDYQPPWRALADAYLLLGNWHLLWYAALALAVVGAGRLVRPPLAPLASVVGWGLALLFLGITFGGTADWFADFAAVNRATLHLAPLLVCLCVLLWRELGAESLPLRPAEPSAPASADA